MSEATQTLEQTLNKTDLGHMIYEKRKIFFGFLFVILIGATGYLLWKQNQKTVALENSQEVFLFQTDVWSKVKEDKKTVQELLTGFSSLKESVKTSPSMVPLLLEMGKFLYEKGLYSEADQLLSEVEGKIKHPVAASFLTMQRVVLLEKLNKLDGAISLLEPLAQKAQSLNPGLIPAKISLDLARLYMAKGEKAKAQTQLDYIMATYPNDEYAKLAKLYLQNLQSLRP